MNIKNIAIFGGNGTVGSLVSALLAGLGNANVYLIARNKNKFDEKLLDKIYSSIKSDAIKEQLILCDYEDIKDILYKCDWIFESVSEDYEIKASVYKQIDKFARIDTIITTGTSGLSVNKLAETFTQERKKYFFGTHFFNPPYHMTLCELIPTEYTDNKIIGEFKNYLEKTILRTTIISKDTPAFIANRIGFKLINDLLLLCEKCQNNDEINYIDSLFTGYTGRNMSPLATIDFVGLDIHKAIVDNIYNKTEDEFKVSFKLPKWFNKLINNGKLGNKVGQGLYKENYVWNIKNEEYNEKTKYEWEEIKEIKNFIKNGEYQVAYKKLFDSSTKECQLVAKTLIQYIIYSLYISNEVAQKIEDCDDAMATGFGWCPPIALKELISEVTDFKKLCTKYIGETIMKKYKLYSLIEELPKSKYDYRKYIRAM